MGKFFRVLLLIINVVCAALLVVSTLTVWLGPSQMRLPSLLSYACPYLFVINALWVIGWLCFSRKEFLVSAIVIVLRIGFVPQFLQLSGTADVPVSDTTLRILSFNAHGFASPNDTLPPAAGAAKFVEILRTEQPDVVSLEEYLTPKGYKLSDTMEALGYRYVRGARNRIAGIVLFSKYPLQEVPREDNGGMICTDVQWPQQTVRLVSVHLDSYQLTADETHAVAHLQYDSSEVRNIFHKMLQTTRQHEQQWKNGLLPIITASPNPVIVAGDYNDTPASYIYQQISKHLNDAFVKQGRGLCTTYKGGPISYRIDHIFCDKSFAVRAYKCFDTDISDHNPVMAVVERISE